MNLAIVIGISEYDDKRNNLPGCKNDTTIIGNVLKKSEKYDDILLVVNNENSSDAKELITDFIDRNKTNEIEEIFFYYTGHGEFVNNEFYYLLTDFKQEKRNQTSLQNTEVDNLLRTLNPNLVVKVVDACQSGNSYIKELGVVRKYFEGAKQVFRNCYFLNSSLNSQSSYQNEEMSFFTRSFVEAIKESKTDEVRYKSIMDYISDEFELIGGQTPFFVVQAEFTEKFCSKNSGLKLYLENFEIDKVSLPVVEAKLSLVERIKKEAKGYSSKEDALKLIENLKTKVEAHKFESLVKDLYEFDISFVIDNRDIPKGVVIGKWLIDNTHLFFAKPTYRTVYENPGDGFRAALSVLGSGADVKKKEVLDGFQLQIETPYSSISIDCNSKFPNLSNYNLTVCFLLSKKAIRFFYFIVNYIEESWDSMSLSYEDIEWKSVEYKITETDSVTNGLVSILTEFETKALKDAQERFRHTMEFVDASEAKS